MRVFNQEMFQEGDKTIRVLAGGGGIGDKASGPIIGTKDMQILGRSSAGNELALTTFHPAAPQGWMQAQGCFVHKEDLCFGGTVEGDVFFNQSKISRVVSCALLSCKCAKSCLGCFQR